jgi:hypothetical protein
LIAFAEKLVETKPGQTVITFTPVPRNSMRAARPIWFSAAFVAQ